MSFYEQSPDPVLRLGDILKGFPSSTIQLNKPIIDTSDFEDGFNLDVAVPRHSVVLTPCCSIGESKLTLCPLLTLPSKLKYEKNPFFAQDITRINIKNKWVDSIPPNEWQSLSAEEKAEKSLDPKGYSFNYIFIFDEHEYLPSYERRGRPFRSYMIDFRTSYSIKSSLIKRSDGNPLDEALVGSKLLQISVEARSRLREKLSHYYGRVPREEAV